ncbi:hypothetical protein PR202_ga17276 [Eleusine coracana subsp. coracana]|uniref:Membrane dipeptidase n=1 Tax=Eleusine coracana subsp. coracana TaxID=191504 RepID=A0AAV5CQI7_ELECO|nr:hypothetical protein PR202_ga17276 [Eleusine coracana subsp. coracana]
MSTPDEQEIFALIKEMKKDASLGSDGLNVAFYRAAWPWIKEDVTALIQEFYNSGTKNWDQNKIEQVFGTNAMNIILQFGTLASYPSELMLCLKGRREFKPN